jgi:hypothetical protein
MGNSFLESPYNPVGGDKPYTAKTGGISEEADTPKYGEQA